jgi:hypothetical protein
MVSDDSIEVEGFLEWRPGFFDFLFSHRYISRTESAIGLAQGRHPPAGSSPTAQSFRRTDTGDEIAGATG